MSKLKLHYDDWDGGTEAGDDYNGAKAWVAVDPDQE